MKRIAVIAAVAALLLAPAASQAQGEKPAAAKPPAPAVKAEKAAPQAASQAAPALKMDKAAPQAAGQAPSAPKMEKAAPKAPSKPAPAPKMEKVAASETGKAPARSGPSRAKEDARSCLELATNTEIIKCAEKFR